MCRRTHVHAGIRQIVSVILYVFVSTQNTSCNHITNVHNMMDTDHMYSPRSPNLSHSLPLSVTRSRAHARSLPQVAPLIRGPVGSRIELELLRPGATQTTAVTLTRQPLVQAGMLYVCVCMYVCMHACMHACVCVCARARAVYVRECE
jgi:hypothetical protein